MIRRLLRHAVGVTTVAEFLRARREQLQPADVGLPDNGRRRTPGLRREEVATLAGVSIDYLVRLEQGRDTKPSPSVIAALADALRLDDEQRRQLYTLAMISQSAELCPAPRPLARAVAPTVTALLERLGPTPAFVVGPANDVLAWNDAWERSSVRSECSTMRGRTSPATCSCTRCAERCTPTGTRRPTSRSAGCAPPTGRWGDDDGFVALMDELRTVAGLHRALVDLRDDREAPRYDAPRCTPTSARCASTTRCSSSPTMSTSNDSSPGCPPTTPPPPRSPARRHGGSNESRPAPRHRLNRQARRDRHRFIDEQHSRSDTSARAI